LSTTTAALAAGKPLACVAEGRDQLLKAKHVAACGLALPESASAADIAHGIDSVLRTRSFQTAAEKIASRSPHLDEGEYAVDLPKHLAASSSSHVYKAATRHAGLL
jgi:UDP:flavonoid glycosyltransferase YjiC (YdhE family)